MEFNFDFLIRNLSRAQAELLLAFIKTFVEACGGEMAGGWVAEESAKGLLDLPTPSESHLS